MNKIEQLYVVWKNPMTRQRFIIGKLTKVEFYIFSYHKDVVEIASREGFHLLDSFPDVEKKYISKDLFTAFEVRLPDKRRRDIATILNRYQMSEYNSFELLKKTQGKLPIDTLEFIEPLFIFNEEITRDFYIAGTQYYLGCSGDSNTCEFPLDIRVGDKLVLKKEPENPYDKNAIEMLTVNNEKLGYIPAYYSREITKVIDENRKLNCIVKKIDLIDCQECIEATLTIYAIG